VAKEAKDLELDAAQDETPRRGKNIVLCADGTGNRGGETPDSNVYRLYKIVELHDPEHPQVKFYDNGVGTSKNKYWRAISGALGGGFKSNVCDLYTFLIRAYQPGDRVYIFGFSRGAATVRAFNDFVAVCGLPKDETADGRELHQDELTKRTEHAFDTYVRARKHGKMKEAEALRENKTVSYGAIPIQFIGVWDTVPALGLPQDFQMKGLILFVVNFLLTVLDRVLDIFVPHRFYKFGLSPNVIHACQALAIDDERQTFLPQIWDEFESPETKVEQVWFAGAHSNVGGGYPRMGLSSVAFEWMLVRAQQCGLHYEPGALDAARDSANPHGRLFNSRDGLAIFYRLEPRDIEELSEGKLRGKVQVHSAVLERIDQRSGNYAPGLLPYEYEVVGTSLKTPPRLFRHYGAPDDWRQAKERVMGWMTRRRWLYTFFLESTLVLVGFAIYWWLKYETHVPENPGPIAGRIWGFLQYILPKALEPFAAHLTFEVPWYYSVPLIVLPPAIMVSLMIYFRSAEVEAREDARKLIRKAWQAAAAPDQIRLSSLTIFDDRVTGQH